MTVVHSVRLFNGTAEVAAFIDRADAEAYIARKPWRGQNGNTEMTIVDLDIPSARVCVVCEEQAVTSTNPDIDFCRDCHYTGRAQARIRAAQIERFTKAFPDASFVGPEHTGGGCFWFAVRFDPDGAYYILTDGEAELPEDDEGQAVPDGGWGCVACYPPMEEDSSMDDDAVRYLHVNYDAVGNWRVGLRDEQAIELIRLHREGKLQGSPE